MNRLFSEGGGGETTGTRQGSEGGHGGDSEDEFYLADDRSAAGHKQSKTWISLLVYVRADD